MNHSQANSISTDDRLMDEQAPSERMPVESEPGKAPRPTVAPVALAVGIMLIPWGILTHGTVTLVGLGLMGWAIGKWVHEIRKEWSEHDRAAIATTVCDAE